MEAVKCGRGEDMGAKVVVYRAPYCDAVSCETYGL